jgi:hypothetical protein
MSSSDFGKGGSGEMDPIKSDDANIKFTFLNPENHDNRPKIDEFFILSVNPVKN